MMMSFFLRLSLQMVRVGMIFLSTQKRKPTLILSMMVRIQLFIQLGMALSIYGCSKLTDQNVVVVAANMELGTDIHGFAAKSTFDEHGGNRKTVGFWGYLLQIIYQ